MIPFTITAMFVLLARLLKSTSWLVVWVFFLSSNVYAQTKISFQEFVSNKKISDVDQIRLHSWLQNKFAGMPVENLRCKFETFKRKGMLPIGMTEKKFEQSLETSKSSYFSLRYFRTSGRIEYEEGKVAALSSTLEEVVQHTKENDQAARAKGMEISAIYVNPRILRDGYGVKDMAAAKKAILKVVHSKGTVKWFEEDPIIINGVPRGLTRHVTFRKVFDSSHRYEYDLVRATCEEQANLVVTPVLPSQTQAVQPIPIHPHFAVRLTWHHGAKEPLYASLNEVAERLPDLNQFSLFQEYFLGLKKLQEHPEVVQLAKEFTTLTRCSFRLEVSILKGAMELDFLNKSMVVGNSIWVSHSAKLVVIGTFDRRWPLPIFNSVVDEEKFEKTGPIPLPDISTLLARMNELLVNATQLRCTL